MGYSVKATAWYLREIGVLCCESLGLDFAVGILLLERVSTEHSV